MADNNISPNMSLPIPNVGTSQGPQYATDVNNSLTIVDSHTHAPGSGVQITPSAMDINTTLTFSNNPATNLQYVNFQLQSSVTQAQSLYVQAGAETPIAFADLWYYDGVNSPIQITSNGAVYAPAASIPGQSYSAGTFIWKQGSGSTTPANFDIGSVTIRPNTSGTSLGVTLSPSSSLATSLTLMLPPTLPSSQSFMTLDSSGNITAPWTVDNNTIVISSNQLVAQPSALASGLTATQAQVNTGTATNVFVSPATLAGKTTCAVFDALDGNYSYTWTAPTDVDSVLCIGRAGAGGGGAGYNGGGGGGGGGGTISTSVIVPVTPGTQYSVTIGAGGAGATSQGSGGSSGSASTFGTFGTISYVTFNNVGLGGNPGTNTTGGTGGTQTFNSSSAGGSGGNQDAHSGSNGGISMLSSNYGGGGSTAGGQAGGGGGGAGDGYPNKTATYLYNGLGGGGSSNTANYGNNGSNGIGGGGGGSNGQGHGGKGSDGQIILIYTTATSVDTST